MEKRTNYLKNQNKTKKDDIKEKEKLKGKI